jgi:hypothetical protein
MPSIPSFILAVPQLLGWLLYQYCLPVQANAAQRRLFNMDGRASDFPHTTSTWLVSLTPSVDSVFFSRLILVTNQLLSVPSAADCEG